MKLLLILTCLAVQGLMYSQTNQFSVEFNAIAEKESAIYGKATNDQLTRTYGLRGSSDAIDGVGTFGAGKTGVFGSGTTFGVYGASAFRAGYFNGDLEYTGTLYTKPSDMKLKNILPKERGMLEIIAKVQVEKYTYKQKEYKLLNLSTGVQYGFIARNLEKVFPNLVNQSHSPSFYNQDENTIVESVDYKTVNYIGMVPILTEGIKELNEKLERQEELISTLINELAELKDR